MRHYRAARIFNLVSPFRLVQVLRRCGTWLEDRLPRVRTERRFVARMREVGRWIEWTRVSDRLAQGAGTLIIEQGTDTIKFLPLPRCWWTADDVLAEAPCEPPPKNSLYFVQFNEDVHPFAEWCSARYLDSPGGFALLTEANWSDDEEETISHGQTLAAELLRLRFPKARIVTTALWKRRCRECGYDLRASSDRCPECGTPVPHKEGAGA